MFRDFHQPAILALILFAAPVVSAGDVTDTDIIRFSAGEPAVAEEVNDNFSALQSAINDNHEQIQDKQNAVSESCDAGKAIGGINADGTVSCVAAPGVETRRITLQAQSLNRDPSRDTYELDRQGIRWQSTFSGAATWDLHKPTDYAGGDLTVTVAFQSTVDDPGYASFFIRYGSYQSGESGEFAPSATADHVLVARGGRVYIQSFSIPASSMQNEWWSLSLQRKGADASTNPETYAEDVILRAVSIEYEVNAS